MYVLFNYFSLIERNFLRTEIEFFRARFLEMIFFLRDCMRNKSIKPTKNIVCISGAGVVNTSISNDDGSYKTVHWCKQRKTHESTKYIKNIYKIYKFLLRFFFFSFVSLSSVLLCYIGNCLCLSKNIFIMLSNRNGDEIILN